MRSTGLLALVLAVIPAIGCGDDIKFPDPIPPPDPALNAVVPANGFTNRTIRVQISGDGTEFSDAAQVVFGTGITTDSVELASPSDLFATITITGAATLGLHDVIVTDGDNTVTLSQAFEVRDPIEIFTVGALLQGGFANLTLINRDTENPWLGALTIQAGAGVGFSINTPNGLIEPLVGDYTIDALVTFDTDAATGKIVVTDTQGDRVLTYQGGDLPVTARTATALTTVKGDFFVNGATMSGSSELFTFTTSALIDASVFPSDKGNSTAEPFIIFLPNGKWANDRGFVSFSDLHPATEPMFLLILDNNALTGYTFDIDVNIDVDLPSPTKLAEAEPNNLVAQAQPSTGDVVLYSGILTDFTDTDLIKVTLAAGETLRAVSTTGAFEFADTRLAILAPNGTTVLVTADLSLGEDIQTTVATAGDHFVRITDASFFGAFNDPYEVALVITAAPPP